MPRYKETDYSIAWQDRRDLGGSSIELTLNVSGVEEEVLRVFCKDYSTDLYMTAFEANIPVDLVEAVIERAKNELSEKPLDDGNL